MNPEYNPCVGIGRYNPYDVKIAFENTSHRNTYEKGYERPENIKPQKMNMKTQKVIRPMKICGGGRR